jgi:hypothetical protein
VYQQRQRQQQQQQQQQQQEQQDAENPFLDPPFSRIKIRLKDSVTLEFAKDTTDCNFK